MKHTSTKKKGSRQPQPRLKWQTGHFDRHAEYRFILPYQFLLLCRLVDVTPEKMLSDFMNNLSCGSWEREGRDEPKQHLINYFISHGYGQHHYSETDIRQIFKEMDALGLLFPKNGKPKMVDTYAKWRDKHRDYLFNEWFTKPKRKMSQNGDG